MSAVGILKKTVAFSLGLTAFYGLAWILSDGGAPSSFAADETPSAAAVPASAQAAPQAAGDSSAGATAPIPAKPESNGVKMAEPDLSDESTAAEMVTELKRRREESDTREKALVEREAELKAKETALDEELKKLQGIREDIAKVEESRKKENDDRVGKIVETVETMSPKTAAPLLSTMDETLAVAAMGKIATPKLAKIMNNMEPRKAARLSELLAGVVRARNAEARAPAHVASNGAAEATEKSAKGGEENDGHSQ